MNEVDPSGTDDFRYFETRQQFPSSAARREKHAGVKESSGPVVELENKVDIKINPTVGQRVRLSL